MFSPQTTESGQWEFVIDAMDESSNAKREIAIIREMFKRKGVKETSVFDQSGQPKRLDGVCVAEGVVSHPRRHRLSR